MSPETPAPSAPDETPPSRAATHAVIAAGVAITAFGLLAIASALGWLPKVGGKAAGFDPDKAGAITRPDPGPPRSTVPLASALLPGETLVVAPEDPHAPAPTEPLMPRYGDPVVPRPAPPRPAEPQPAPRASPAAPWTPPPVARAIAPETPRWVRSPPEAPAAARRCNRCGVVTEISPWIDQWDVHVRFEDGTRRVLRYPAPPNVARGDRVVFENGRLLPD